MSSGHVEIVVAIELRLKVVRLPLRVAEVTHALMEAWTQAGGGPITTHEVWEYDSRSLTLGATSSALTRALDLDLVDRAAPRGLWFATTKAWEMRHQLEDVLLSGSRDDG